MLAGTRVLDLTRYLPGPHATRILADLGAEVIKVEGPAAPDPFRAWPPLAADGTSPTFDALNRGKRCISLDLEHAAGRELLLRLAGRADVLVEGFRPGVLERLGLGPQQCQARNPALVYCSISGFGQDGPYRDRPGHDLTYLALSGFLSVLAGPDGRPAMPGPQVADVLGAYGALVGILGALVGRAASGRGEVVDVSLTDVLVDAQRLGLVRHAAGLPLGPGRAPLHGGWPCYRVYEAADGRAVALGALEPKFWRAFCGCVGRPEWEERGRDPDLVPELERLFRSRDAEAWRALEDAGCCLAVVRRYDELGSDPQLAARGVLDHRRCDVPVRFANRRPAPRSGGAPRPGEHTAEVLSSLLGLDEAELARLEAGGAIGMLQRPAPDGRGSG